MNTLGGVTNLDVFVLSGRLKNELLKVKCLKLNQDFKDTSKINLVAEHGNCLRSKSEYMSESL